MNGSGTKLNRRILVVDDNRAIHADFQKSLGGKPEQNSLLSEAAAELFGSDAEASRLPQFELASAYQGQEGLAIAQAAAAEGNPFALAFVDIRMPPGWDGIETTIHMLKVDPDLQIVICTAYSDYSWEEMTRRLGSPDRLVILKKPFDVIEIQQLANSLTEKWRLSRQARITWRNWTAWCASAHSNCKWPTPSWSRTFAGASRPRRPCANQNGGSLN